jgi:hypothetical protein
MRREKMKEAQKKIIIIIICIILPHSSRPMPPHQPFSPRRGFCSTETLTAPRHGANRLGKKCASFTKSFLDIKINAFFVSFIVPPI